VTAKHSLMTRYTLVKRPSSKAVIKSRHAISNATKGAQSSLLLKNSLLLALLQLEHLLDDLLLLD
jgi:hypothetical protein